MVLRPKKKEPPAIDGHSIAEMEMRIDHRRSYYLNLTKLMRGVKILFINY